uniref:TOG domain-containing protein n=1 Tax=Caenorhabditis tropicalis TaxID=1561998 RepID=A0A1I7T5Y2_9PELO
MDEWSILDEVDVLAKWPSEHKKAVLEAGSKWKERKEGLEALNTIIEQNPRLSTTTMTIYGELMDEIRKVLDRETNIVVVTTAIRTVELMAKGLRHKFSGFIGMVVPFLIKRAKDKKKNVRDAVLGAMAAVSDTTTPERVQKDIVDWFGIPSPESKQTLLSFLFAYFCRQYSPDIPFVKTIAPLIVKASSESDVAVRDKACQALGGLKRLMGDAISAFLVPISTETAKIEKIQQYQEEAIEEFRKFQESQPKSMENGQIPSENSENSGETTEEVAATSSGVMDPWEIMDSEDVTKKIDKGVEAQLVDKNWKERVAGGESVKKSMEGVLRIDLPDRLVEILKILIKIIEKDVNVNVASLSAQILKDVAQKSRFAFASIAHRAFPVVFDKLKDKKAVLRDALVEYCDEAANTTPLSAYSEAVIAALGSKNPQTRQQTALFLSRFFAKNDTKTMEIEAVKQLVEHITKVTNDADKEVREAAIRVVAAIQKSMGEAISKRLLAEVYDDKLKADKIPTIVEELETEFGKSATPEMLRLAKHYKIGGPAPSSSGAPKRATSAVAPRPKPTPSATSRPGPSRPSTAKPSGTVRPVQSASRAPVVARRAPSPTSAPPPPRPKPFVARPAPSFAAKPRAAVAPATSKPIAKVSATPAVRPGSSAPRATATRVAPIAPNVIRRQAPPTSSMAPPTQKPIGIARPQTAGTTRSRISAPTSGIARPGTSLPRPSSSSRIARPPSGSRPSSRPGSRNE